MIASSLRTTKSYIIGIVIPDVSNSFFGRLVLSIEKILYQGNYRYILSNTDEEIKKEQEYMLTFMKYNTDEIITATSAVNGRQKVVRYYRDFLSQGKPVVFVDRVIEGLDASYVIVDNAGVIIEQPVEEMGIIAATILMDLLNSSKRENRKVVLKARLIERGSVSYLKN